MAKNVASLKGTALTAGLLNMGISLSKQHDPWKRIIIPRRMLKVKCALSCGVFFAAAGWAMAVTSNVLLLLSCTDNLSNIVFPNLFSEISAIPHDKLLVQKTLGDCLLPSSGNLVEGSRKEKLSERLQSILFLKGCLSQSGKHIKTNIFEVESNNGFYFPTQVCFKFKFCYMLAKQSKAILKLDKSTTGTLKRTYISIHNLVSIRGFSMFCFMIISLEFVSPASQ